jgi:ABC-type multidrug transport system fused ATPase/permease subunit
MALIFSGRSWWLKLWTGNGISTEGISHTLSYSLHVQSFSTFSTTNTTRTAPAADDSDRLSYYLGIYVMFSALVAILGTIRYFYIFTGSIRASRKLFDKLSYTILRTPLRWMDTVPLGRILNRFTADFNVVDSRLANNIAFGAHNVFRLIGVVVAG